MTIRPTRLLWPTLCVALLAAPLSAQQTLDMPRGEFVEYRLDSGLRGNAGRSIQTVFSQVIEVQDASWIRVYFAEALLEPGSFVRLTSLLDLETQELDARAMVEWSHGSAYFNGDAVLLEVVAGPGTTLNKVAIDHVAAEIGPAQIPVTLCGLCGEDDRTPSSMDFAGRIMPTGCSAAVFNQASCVVSAGHCMGGANVIQFRVPNSLPNCNLVNPPVADQFPILESEFSNEGPGSDWAVFRTGTNNLGQTIYDRYGEFRPIANSVPSNGAVNVWGFGSSKTCTVNQTQQRSQGFITGVGMAAFSHTADTTGGNSGSGVLHNDEIIGIVTHCPCPNTAQRIDHAPFVAAREELCPNPAPANDTCQNATAVFSSLVSVSNVFALTNGPDEPGLCNFNGTTQIHNDVWYKFIASCTGTATVSLCGSSTFDAKMAVYAACPTGPGEAIACSDNECGNRPRVSFPVTANAVYRVRIGSATPGATGNAIMEITCEPDQQPCPGDVAPAGGDGVVNVDDLLVVIGNWGCNGTSCAGDTNGDNTVNVDDLLGVISAWGPCS